MKVHQLPPYSALSLSRGHLAGLLLAFVYACFNDNIQILCCQYDFKAHTFCGNRDKNKVAGKIMLLKLLQNKLFIMVFGAVLFWGPYIAIYSALGFRVKHSWNIDGLLGVAIPVYMIIVAWRYKVFLVRKDLPFKKHYILMIGFAPLIISILFTIVFSFSLFIVYPASLADTLISLFAIPLYSPLTIFVMLIYSGMIGAIIGLLMNCILFSVFFLVSKGTIKQGGLKCQN